MVPQSNITKRIVLKKKAPKSPVLGIPSSSVKHRRLNNSVNQKNKLKQEQQINEIISKRPSKEEPNLSRSDSRDDRLPPSTSTIKKEEGFQWECTQLNVDSSIARKPPKTPRTLRSLDFKTASNNFNSDEEEELNEYNKLLNENW